MALVTFSHIPVKGGSLTLARVGHPILSMGTAGLLAWLTIGAAVILTGRQVINRLRPLAPGHAEPGGGRQATARAGARWAARIAGAAAAPLIMLASWLGTVQRMPPILYDAPLVQAVNVSFHLIDQALPSQPMMLSVVGACATRRTYG